MNKHLARILVAVTAATITMAQPIASYAVNSGTDIVQQDQGSQETTAERTYSFVVDGEAYGSSQTIKSGETLTQPETPTKEGYAFKGWYADGSEDAFDFSQAIAFDAENAGNVTLTAKFEEEKQESEAAPAAAERTYVFQNGDSAAEQTVKSGEKLTKPENPSEDGKVFEGWYSEDGTEFTDFDTKLTFEETTTVTLNAKFRDMTEEEKNIQAVYEKLMAAETAEEFYKIEEELTEEEQALADKFSEAQQAKLQAKMEELGCYAAEAIAEEYTGTLTITDSIKTDGKLTVSGTGLDGETVVYTWEKKEDGSDTWTAVERKKVTGDEYNMAEDGSWINVALDGGARATYRAAVKSINGVDVSRSTTSAGKQVSYYDELRNGSFETPVITVGQSDKQNPVYGGGDVIWNTTDTESNRIEIVSPTKNPSSVFQWHGVISAYDGNQCAEINAEAASSLYQDVLTTPGSTMYWQLAHLGRAMNGSPVGNTGVEKTDTMYVLIMPYSSAQDVTTQDKVQYVMNHLDEYPGAQVTKITYTWRWATTTTGQGWNRKTTYTMQHEVNDSWVDTYEYTDGNFSSAKQITDPWELHSGTYEVPEGQYLTRYFFVAGDTATGDNTVGNHIDKVYFSTKVPDPNPGSANLTIQKTINVDGWDGMTDDQKAEFRNAVTFTYDDKTITGSQMTWNGNVGSYTAVISLGTAASKNVTVTETTTDVSGYTRDAEKSTEQTQTVTLNDGGTTKAEFTNAYVTSSKSLTITKTLSGNMYDSAKEFSFTITSDKDMTWTETTSGGAETKSGTTITFRMKKDWSTTTDGGAGIYDIKIPAGAAVTVTEDRSGYVCSLTVPSGWAKDTDYTEETEDGGALKGLSFKMPSSDVTITFDNNKDAVPDTGVVLDTLPYILILAVVAVGVVIFVKKRGKHSDD